MEAIRLDNRSQESGFTLVELLVVVLIIGVLAAKRLPLIAAAALALSLGVAGCSFSAENNTPEKEKATVTKDSNENSQHEADSTQEESEKDGDLAEVDALIENTVKDIYDIAYSLAEELPEANGYSSFKVNNELTLTLSYGEDVPADEEGFYTRETVREVEESYTIPDGVEIDLDISTFGLVDSEIADDFAVIKGWHEDSDTYNSEETAMVYPSEDN